ncbi:HNH endonuclease, partial [Nocardia tengchongensis]|uniref:HNH endonuclease n=1 Tax=Nocardia tengchongensis TaxID=2055889 RepID=UPI0036BC4ADE
VWESNEGYPDVLGSCYIYDSGVARHLQVAVGDMVVLWDSALVQGVSRIDRIDKADGIKVRWVCPRCERTGYVKRTKTTPTFLCRHKNCRHTFETPLKKDVPVTLFTASYGAQWLEIDGALTDADLEPLLDRAQQNAIRACDSDGLVKLLDRLQVPMPAEPAPRSTPPKGGHRDALVRARNGQDSFRQALMRRDGLVCAVTGPCPSGALEAAHLRAFAKHGTHDPDEGILLRSDIHRLFDRGLIAVDPETLTVVIAPSLEPFPDYRALVGKPLKSGPYLPALADHHREATASW